MFRNLNYFKSLLIAAACLVAAGLPAAGFAAEAGKFQFIAGDVKIVTAAGVQRVPVKGEAYSAGDTIVTGATGSAQIRMTDGGLVAVRPDTEMKLDQYIFNGREDGSERKVVSLIKGGFRAITGLIGNRNKENYRILTPSATIGIRGTDHEPVVIPAGAKGGFQPGTYDRVYRGATIIETDKGKLIVNPNQVGFTPGKGIAPVLLPKIPEFYNAKASTPEVARDPQKDTKADDGGSSEKSADTTAKGTTVRSLSTLKSDSLNVKEALTDTSATRLTSPLDSSSVNSLKSDSLTTPLSDTSLKSTLSTTTLKDTSTLGTSTLKSDALATPVTVPTTTLRSTDVLTVPTTTTSTLKSATTTTVTTPITTVTPTTTISPKITESVTVPTTTIRSTITK